MSPDGRGSRSGNMHLVHSLSVSLGNGDASEVFLLFSPMWWRRNDWRAAFRLAPVLTEYSSFLRMKKRLRLLFRDEILC